MECDGLCDGSVKESGLGFDDSTHKGVEKMEDEGRMSGAKRRGMETRLGVESNDDEPIGAMVFKMKSKRNSKKVKVGFVAEGIEDKEIGLGEGIEDLGGMGDTLANYKKKLKRPRKSSISVRNLDIFGDGACGLESTSDKVKGEGLAVEESKTLIFEGSCGTVGGSNECLEVNVEESLSSFFLKAQSFSTRKSRNSMRSKQLGKVHSSNDGLSSRSDPKTSSISQSPLEPIVEVVGFDNNSKCDRNKINNTQDSGDTCSQKSNTELSSSSLISHSVLRSTGDTCSETQIKIEDALTISFSQQSDPYFKSCPNTISTLQDGEVVGQTCDNKEGTKLETFGLNQLIAENAKEHLCLEVKENLCFSGQEPSFGNRISEDDIKSSSVKKACDPGNVVVEIPMSVSAHECVHSNLSHGPGQKGFKAIVKSEGYSLDQSAFPKLEHDPKGSYLGNVSMSNSYEHTCNETTNLISREHLESCVLQSDNTLTSHEEFFVMSKHDEPNFGSSQKEEPSPLVLSPFHEQESNLRVDLKQNDDKPDSLTQDALMDKYDTSVPRCTSSSHQTQSSDDVFKGLSVLSCDFSGDEVADGSSSPSTGPDCNKNHNEDMGLVPSHKDKDRKPSERVMRNIRKRRQWDMAYEGDADWNFLVHDENFIADDQDEDDSLFRRREKLKPSSMFLEAKNGRIAAVSYGLKARVASPVEKIRFKEVLKRKGGLHMYLECRNHILGLWNKDVSCILPLSDCGVSPTPVVADESPDASLIREIYAFLDHFAYINIGVASDKGVSESPSIYNLQVSTEKNLGGKSGAIFGDSDDGVSFIIGKSSNPDSSLEGKNLDLHDSEIVVAMDEGDMPLHDLQALKASTLTKPEKTDDNQGNGRIDGVDSVKIGTLDSFNSASPCKVADGGTAPFIHTEPTKKINRTQYDSVDNKGLNPCIKNHSEVGKQIIIIGAGPAGLAAARHLQRQGFQVMVLEARGRIGGRVFTDRTSLSVPVDLGASIITGVEADVAAERRPDPSSLVCSQMGLELTVLNSDCPLYDTVTGDKVPADLDKDLESEFNNLIDDMELLVAQKGEHAMKMSLEDGLEFALQRRRITQYERNGGTSNLHKLADVDKEVLGDGNSKGEILSPLERRVMDWHFAHLEYGCAASLKDVSLPCWNQDDIYGGFGGAHCMIKGGYSTVVEALGEGLCIHLNHVVTSVTYRTEDVVIDEDQHHKVKVSTSNGRDFFGDAVLITVPLGCLKKESIKFAPPLPHWKHSSIQRLGFGLLNKVVLEFPEVFWDDSVDYFGTTAEETDKRGHCFMFWNVRKTVGAPVLIALVVGKAALDGQDRNSSEHVNHALVVLRKLFGVAAVPDPTATVVTDWGRDPYSYGAYSYVAIGASGEDYDILGSPVENCLFFAGEATCKEHPDTVGGAMMSGIREAVRIMNILTTGIDYTAEVNAMEAAQRCIDSEQSEVRDIIKRLEAVQMSNALYEKSLDGGHVITRKDLLQEMFSKAKTTSGRLHLIKELLNFPVRVLKSFAGTKEGLSILNAWILDSLGKDGTQLLRHCVRLLTLVSTDLLAVRVSGIGKTVKEKVCLHTSRDIRAVASQLVDVWIEVFRKQKASNGGLKLLRQSSAVESSKSKYNLDSGKPPAPHGAPPPHNKKGINPAKMENRTQTKSNIKLLNSQGSTGRHDSKMEEEKQYVPSEEEKAILAAEEAARAAAIAAAKAYALSGSRCNTSVQLPKIPSFNKYARREHYPQLEEPDIRTLEIDSRNCKVRDWTADFSSSHANLGSSKRSVENLSQHSYSNEAACQVNFREHPADSAAVDSSIFTRAWVDSAGSEGIKDGSAIERWQSQAAAADSEFYSRTRWMMDEEETNVNSRSSIKKHEGQASERSTFQVTTVKELVENQPRGPEKIKHAVVDHVASLLMPLYKAKKFDKDGYKSIMKKTATKVMEQATDAEKSMTVSDFLDSKRKNKIRAFVDMLIERLIANKPGGR